MATVVGLFSSLFAGAARAECAEGDDICGTNCCYHITEEYNEEYDYVESRTATVYAAEEGKEAIFNSPVFNNNEIDVDQVIFSEGITKITASPEGYNSYPTVYLPDSLEVIQNYETITSGAGEFVFSDSIDTTEWDKDAFNIWIDYGLFCVGNLNTCKEKLSGFKCIDSDNTEVSCIERVQPASEEYCTGNYQWVNESCVKKSGSGNGGGNNGGSSAGCGEGQLEKNGGCISASQGCGDGYRQIETWCNKIRWTPAEAAQVLTNDNNNTVTITFRK